MGGDRGDEMGASEALVGPAVGDLIPPFTLEAVGGGVVRRHDYRGRRHLILAFTHGVGCPSCAALLEALAGRYADYRAEGAEVLAFLPADESRCIAQAGGAAALPYPLLCDAEGRVGARYGARTPAGEPLAALLVADRHGEVVLRAVAGEASNSSTPAAPTAAAFHGLPLNEVLPLVSLLQVRCSI
jgi:peroxiredoxin